MKIASYIGLAIGLTLLTGLIAWQGLGDVVAILFSTGWSLLLIPLVWFPTVLLNARSWQLLFAAENAPKFVQAFLAQWIGRAVNTLLPVATIGGEIVKARVLTLWGLDVRHTSASVVVDKTIQVITIIIWGLIGIILLAWMSLDHGIAATGLIGLTLLGFGVVGFIVAQRAGLFGFMAKSAKLISKEKYFSNLQVTAEGIDLVVIDVYRRKGQVFRAGIWRLSALILLTGEVWLAAYLLGYPIGLIEALMLKSLSSTLSDAAFVVPNSYGVQEGAFVVLGSLVGLAPDVAIAISLAIRLREILIDIPGLVFWQITEGKILFRHRRDTR